MYGCGGTSVEKGDDLVDIVEQRQNRKKQIQYVASQVWTVSTLTCFYYYSYILSQSDWSTLYA